MTATTPAAPAMIIASGCAMATSIRLRHSVHLARGGERLEHHAAGQPAAFHRHVETSWRAMLGKGDTFVSQDLQRAHLFGDYRVDGAVMNVAGYNDS
jgi:hypothetical protein